MLIKTTEAIAKILNENQFKKFSNFLDYKKAKLLQILKKISEETIQKKNR